MSELKLDPNKEYTLILVKPDGYRRGLVGKILARIEQKGYAIVVSISLNPWLILCRAEKSWPLLSKVPG